MLALKIFAIYFNKIDKGELKRVYKNISVTYGNPSSLKEGTETFVRGIRQKWDLVNLLLILLREKLNKPMHVGMR